MTELNLDDLLKVAESEKLATNANSLSDLLKEIDNIIKQGDKILSFVNRIERSPAIGTLIKSAMKKQGVEVSPLVTDGGIIANSDLHKQVFENMNKMNEDQLKNLLNAFDRYNKEQNNGP